MADFDFTGAQKISGAPDAPAFDFTGAKKVEAPQAPGGIGGFVRKQAADFTTGQGDVSYPNGAGYLIDNPITRGLGSAANSAATGLAYLARRGVGAISPSAGEYIRSNIEQPLVERGQQLEAPASASPLEVGAQNLAGIAGTVSTAAAGGGTSLPARALTALRFGVPQAGAQAEAKEQAGQEVTPGQLAAMTAVDTATGLLPASLGGGFARRALTGAGIGLAANTATNAVTGQDLSAGALPSTLLGAGLGAALPHPTAKPGEPGEVPPAVEPKPEPAAEPQPAEPVAKPLAMTPKQAHNAAIDERVQAVEDQRKSALQQLGNSDDPRTEAARAALNADHDQAISDLQNQKKIADPFPNAEPGSISDAVNAVAHVEAPAPQQADVGKPTTEQNQGVASEHAPPGPDETPSKTPLLQQYADRAAQIDALNAQRKAGTLSPEQSDQLHDLRDAQDRVNPVSGLPNRKAFDEAMASGEFTHTTMADVDGFKAVNDKLGHGVGDLMLQHIGQELAAAKKPGLSPFHLSGDEFAFLSKGDPSGPVGEIQHALDTKPIELQYTDADGNQVTHTFKGVGLTFGSAEGQGPHAVEAADHAASQSKTERIAAGITDRRGVESNNGAPRRLQSTERRNPNQGVVPEGTAQRRAGDVVPSETGDNVDAADQKQVEPGQTGERQAGDRVGTGSEAGGGDRVQRPAPGSEKGGDVPKGSLTHDDIKRIYAKATEGWKNAPALNVHDTGVSDTIPEPIRNHPEFDLTNKGWFHRGAINVVRGNIRSEAELRTVIEHEAGHAGLRAFLGDKYNAFMGDMKQLDFRDPLLKKARDQIKRNYGENGKVDPHVMFDEMIGHLSENYATVGGRAKLLMKRIIAETRSFLSKVSGKSPDSYSDAEVLRYVARARAAVKEGTSVDMTAPRFQKVDKDEQDHAATRAAARAVLGPESVRGSDGVLADPYGKNSGTGLDGAPKQVVIPGVGKVKATGFKPAQDAARAYAKAAGIDYKPPTKYARVDPERATAIAKAYDEMKHDPSDPQVKAAYDAMIKETLAQYAHIAKSGLKVEFINGPDPYASNPRLAILDVVKNNHMWVYPTEAGFGSNATFDPSENPLLAKTGIKISGKEATANDIFRVVHDYFGHVQHGVGFRADGEENAWRSHSAMYSPLARKAMTSETRGQNSWVNYGPHGEANRSASSDKTVFADQKTGLLPDWVSREGADDETAFKKGGADDRKQPDYLPVPKTKSPEFSVRKAQKDSVSAVGVHYSAVDGLEKLDPTQAGGGSAGGETRRYGLGRTGDANPRLYFYAQIGDELPKREAAVQGNIPYRVKLNNLYDIETDPRGFRKDSGANGDLMREEIHDAGFDGLVTPPPPGIDHPVIEYFGHKKAVPVERVEDAAFKKRDLNEVPGLKAVAKHLLPAERAKLRADTAEKLVGLFKQLPSDMAHAALAGQAKRGWYQNTAHALVHVFGPDSPRFASLLAATSPQTSVESNLKNALNIWKNWTAAGRPTDPAEIKAIMGRSVEGQRGEGSVLGAWVPNTVRALTAEDPANITLSGPKVHSFMKNLMGHADEVTNDSWMASFGAVDQTIFSGSLTKDDPGKRPGYLAMSARTREAAAKLTKMTGETWTPAEVQETVWSWAKTLAELGEAKGETRSLPQLLKDGAVTDALIKSTPDFRTLLHEPTYKKILDQAGLGQHLDTLTASDGAAGKSAVAGAAGEAGKAAPDPRLLERAAKRLEAFRASRNADTLDGAKAEPSTEDVPFKKDDDHPEFYSALNRSVAEAKGMPKAGGEQLKQWLDGAQRRGEFKGSERQWMGIDQWLDANPKATREDLQNFIRANEVKVTPVKKGDLDALPLHDAVALTLEYDRIANETFSTDFHDLDAEDRDWVERHASRVGDTKFDQYVLPGGENYREHLLTLPQGEGTPAYEKLREQADALRQKKLGEVLPDGRTVQATLDDLHGKMAALQEAPSFNSSHFDEPNILAHVRMNDRTTSDGAKALHIEEIQSDWHQKGRKQGYNVSDKDITATREQRQPWGDAWVIRDKEGKVLGAFGASLAKNEAEAKVEARSHIAQGVPDAPLKSTEDWAMLGFKHALREAIDTGKDKVTWTTGEQQAERYDLSKQLDAVRALKKDDGTYTISGKRVGSRYFESLGRASVPEAELADVVGKELAQKIVDAGGGVFSGVDLKVGGEGMKGFYDKILPKAVAKYVKQWGGKVDQSKISTRVTEMQAAANPKAELGRTFAQVHSVDITPEMRKSVAEGQPLFKKADADDAEAKLKQMAKDDRENARNDVRAAFAQSERNVGAADIAMAALRKEFDRQINATGGDAKKLYESISKLERGETVDDHAANALWKGTQDLLKNQLERLNALGADIHERANYFSHIWKDQGRAATEDLARAQKEEMAPTVGQRRPLSGNKYYAKERVFETMMDGLNAGREPISKNPVDMFMARYAQGEKLAAALTIKKALGDRGFIRDLENDRVPIGYQRVNDGVFAGKTLPELIARDLNNHLDPGLSRFQGWRQFRYIQNLMLTARLGLSAFHAGMTTLDSMATHIDVGMRRATSGDLKGALHDLYQASVAPLTTIQGLAGKGVGAKLVRQFFGQEAADPHTAALLDMAMEGGARAKMSSTDYNNSLSTFRRALAQGDIKTAVVNAVPAALELTTHHIAQNLVPAQKMQARVTLLKFELDKISDQLRTKGVDVQRGDYAGIKDAMGVDAMRQISRKVNADVDDRLGQFAYDNEFLNKTVKDALHASVQSVGWNFGTLRLLLGGISDLVKLKNPEAFRGPLDKAGNIQDAKMSRLTGRLSYLITLNAVVAMMGAMTQYALTGDGPQEAKDWFFPKTGRKNSDDSDERLAFPSYVKDEYSLAHHPLTTLQHKLHPSLSMLAEIAANKDFYGTQVYDPEAPIPTEAKQFMEYLGKSFLPYSLQGAAKNQKAGASVGMAIAPFVGITPASGEVTKSPFQAYVAEKYFDTLPQGARTAEAAEASGKFRDAVNARRRGETPDTTGMTAAQIRSVYQRAATPMPESSFQKLGIVQQLHAWDVASPEERQKYKLRQLLLHGAGAKIAKLPEEQRQEIQQRVNAIVR